MPEHVHGSGPIAEVPAVQLSPAIAARIREWAPQFAQRGITEKRWLEWAPLVRQAVTLSQPSSPQVAASLLGDALSLVQFAVGRRVPLRLDLVFRRTTADAFLGTVTASSRATVASRIGALVEAASRPVPSAAPDDALETCLADEPVEPLLLPASALDTNAVHLAGLDSPVGQQALGVLRAIREQVLAVEPNALKAVKPFRGRGRAVPYGDVEVVGLLAGASVQRSAKRRLATPPWSALVSGLASSGTLP